MGLGAYYGVHSGTSHCVLLKISIFKLYWIVGYLKPSVRYGATPKIVVSVILGYFIGKMSYQRKCAEKLMQLPDSKLGEILRRRKHAASGSLQERYYIGRESIICSDFFSS